MNIKNRRWKESAKSFPMWKFLWISQIAIFAIRKVISKYQTINNANFAIRKERRIIVKYGDVLEKMDEKWKKAKKSWIKMDDGMLFQMMLDWPEFLLDVIVRPLPHAEEKFKYWKSVRILFTSKG